MCRLLALHCHMINLLPEQEKGLLHKEYKFRLFAVSLSMLFFLLLFAVVLIVPSFVFSVYKLRAAEGTSSATVNAELQKRHADLLARVRKAKSALMVLKSEEVKIMPTDVVSTIVAAKTDRNTITSIAYTRKEGAVFKATVKGVAENRQSLLEFTNALENKEAVGSVNLPVSNFAKENNIEFTFEVIGK